VALIYLLFGAPDVAMTQFSIETLTVILVVLTLLHLPGAGFERPRPYSALRDFLVSLATGGAISAVLLSVLSGPLPDRISDWYLHHSYPDAHGRNIVNVILVDFRGFDTWGEITVLTIAGLGVYALLRRRARGGRSASMVGARKEAP
jgi:multicomponent Na+:H+ antiporter subunit A